MMHFSKSIVSSGLALGVLLDSVLGKPYVVDVASKVAYLGLTSSRGVETFLGSPYGKDISGANRFAPPRAFETPAGYVFNATEAGADCPQA